MTNRPLGVAPFSLAAAVLVVVSLFLDGDLQLTCALYAIALAILGTKE